MRTEDGRVVFPCELSLMLGLLVVACSVCLFIRSGYGVTVISSIPLMVSYALPVLDFGTWNIIYQLVLICLCVLVTRRFSGGYIISIVEALLFGAFLNVMKGATSGMPTSPELDVLYLVLAMVLLFFAVSFFMRAYIPLLPCDVFIRDVVITFHIRYRVFKTVFDVFCMSASAVICWLALGKITDLGLGTLISAFLTGYFVSLIATRVFDRFFVFEPATGFFRKFVSDDKPVSQGKSEPVE